MRELSYWGWGWADKFPDESARLGIASMVEGLFGLSGLTPRSPPPLSAVTIPEGRVTAPAGLPVTSDREARVRHTYGRAYPDLVRGFRGDFAAAPDLVATPADERDVEAIVAWCAREGVVCVPYGGGTSVVGGVERPGRARPALSLDLRRLDRVLDVDLVSRAARIQAGALGPVLEQQLAPHGVTLRHFPQSFEFSTLGGWIATRAGGHFATLYTHIDDLVESVRMVTPTGIWESRRLPASGAGPAPDRIVLGSEGILGVITEAWVRVQARPRWRARANVLFDGFAAAARGARAVAQAGLYPSNCRVLEAREALLNNVAAEGKDVLLLAFESADHPLDAWIDRAVALAVAEGGRVASVKKDEADASRTWRDAFLDAPYLQTALVSLGVIADTFETACTWDRFPALDAAVRAAVLGAMPSPGVITCRFTHVYPDGPAPYYTFVVPAEAGADELVTWRRIKDAACEALAAGGATITHHHAVGRTHRPWYERERPEPMGRLLQAMKRELDPTGILNPGVLVADAQSSST